MCGIAGFLIKNPEFVKRHSAVETFANLLLVGIEHRGKEATGFVSVTPGGHNLTMDKKPVIAGDFVKDRAPIPEGANIWLGHTRLPTQGDVKDNENNHPVICRSTFVTHNGSIKNDKELFDKIIKRERGAEVDSIAIPSLLARHSLGEVGEIRKSLEELDGIFAIAAIDPVNVPDQVVLAKGGWPPLYIHESDHFIVWASTREAIRDAWKVVLGTPPAHKNFREVKDGEIVIVTKEGLESHEFKHKVGFQTQSTANGRRTTSGGRANYRSSNSPMTASQRRRDTNLTAGRHVVAVGEIRRDGEGKARLFESHQQGKYTDEDLEGVPRPLAFAWCDGCMTSVLKDDMIDTLQWGKICKDCYSVCLKNSPAENPLCRLSDEEVTTVENWAKMESEVHLGALQETSEWSGLSEETIDFLIFRVPDNYVERVPEIKQLASDLDDFYQERMEEGWAAFGVTDAENLRVREPVVESDSGAHEGRREHFSPGERPDGVWRSCSTHHETFKSDEECSGCIKDFIQKSAPNLELKSCRVCRHRTKYHMLNWAWCRKHYTCCVRCSDDGVVGIQAIATAPNGDRICHQHSRGEKGTIADGELEHRGIEVAERA